MSHRNQDQSPGGPASDSAPVSVLLRAGAGPRVVGQTLKHRHLRKPAWCPVNSQIQVCPCPGRCSKSRCSPPRLRLPRVGEQVDPAPTCHEEVGWQVSEACRWSGGPATHCCPGPCGHLSCLLGICLTHLPICWDGGFGRERHPCSVLLGESGLSSPLCSV